MNGYRKSVFAIAAIASIVLILLICIISGDRCEIVDASALTSNRCGHPVTNWFYDFQTLIAGIFASLAAVLTVCTMNKNTRTMVISAKQDYYNAVVRAHDMVAEGCKEVEKKISSLDNACAVWALLRTGHKISKSMKELISTIDRIQTKNWDIEFSFSLACSKRKLGNKMEWFDKLYSDNKDKIAQCTVTMDDLPHWESLVSKSTELNSKLLKETENSKQKFIDKHPGLN